MSDKPKPRFFFTSSVDVHGDNARKWVAALEGLEPLENIKNDVYFDSLAEADAASDLKLRVMSDPAERLTFDSADLVWSTYSECWMTPDELRAEREEMQP